MTTKLEVMTAAATGEGCLGRSANDEPIFVLCARDPLAPLIVRTWVTRYALSGSGGQQKIAGALNIADAMETWRETQDSK